MLLKNLHIFFNKNDTPQINLIWDSYYSNNQLPGARLQGSFWWKAPLKLLDCYKGMARCTIGNGNSTLFWHDLWSSRCLHHSFPHLYSFTRNIDVSVRHAQYDFLEDLSTCLYAENPTRSSSSWKKFAGMLKK